MGVLEYSKFQVHPKHFSKILTPKKTSSTDNPEKILIQLEFKVQLNAGNMFVAGGLLIYESNSHVFCLPQVSCFYGKIFLLEIFRGKPKQEWWFWR